MCRNQRGVIALPFSYYHHFTNILADPELQAKHHEQHISVHDLHNSNPFDCEEEAEF